MSLRSQIAIATGKFARWFLTTFTKGGSSLPGKIALTLDSNVLQALSKDYEVIIVSGTNGKTLTTSLIVQLLKQKYASILTNPTGANLVQGIVSTFLSHPPTQGGKKIAVLEIDEATIKHVTKYIKPKYFVFTNIFRDQMDRFGEIYTTYQFMLDGVALAPNATIVANGDTPIFNSKTLPNPQIFYGFNHKEDGEFMAESNSDGVLCPHCHNILHYKFLTYSNLGKYYCPSGDFKRPELSYAVTELTNLSFEGSTFKMDDYTYQIPIAGLYNIYNALAAYSIARLYDIDQKSIQQGFQAAQRVFGRQEKVNLPHATAMINLIKNPVGFNQVAELLAHESEPFELIILLNDNYADGQDVSWIWDAHFEKLFEHSPIYTHIGGIRVADLSLRMEVAGFGEQLPQFSSIEKVVSYLAQTTTPRIHILATYTALLELRKELGKSGHLKEVGKL